MACTLWWLGHSAFRLESPTGLRLYVDPWLENPDCPEAERSPAGVDAIALTHGHHDHVGQALELWGRFRPQIVAPYDLRAWLEGRGLPRNKALAPNKGGTVTVGDLSISITDARHSSGTPDGGYGGEAVGLIVRARDGTCIYFAGDTCAFLDMQLIGRLHRPDLAVLPIGGHFTMGPAEARLALELLGAKRCLPCHYRTTFDPLLPGKPAQLRALAEGACEVIELAPGESVRV